MFTKETLLNAVKSVAEVGQNAASGAIEKIGSLRTEVDHGAAAIEIRNYFDRTKPEYISNDDIVKILVDFYG